MPQLPDPLRKKLLAVSGADLLTIAACYTAFWEGHATQPYADSGGVLTVCYGHTGGDITPETTKTPAQCEALLAADMRQAFAVIDQQVTVPLSDGQRVALAEQRKIQQVFHTLEQTVTHEKQHQRGESEKDRQQVRLRLSRVNCAREPVPGPVADRVRHAARESGDVAAGTAS